MASVVIEDSDPNSMQAFEKLIKSEGMEEYCTVMPGKIQGILVIRSGTQSIQLQKPVRAGTVLAQVRSLLSPAAGKKEYVQIGQFMLDKLNYELSDRKRVQPVVRLTEKEGKILIMLAAAEGKIVEREVLLDSVWGYAKGVETHTLETHIYRLRQKIEQDPSNPQILLTEPTGYKISF